MKVKEVLKKEVDKLNSYNIEEAILKVQILIEYHLGISHKDIIKYYEDDMRNDLVQKIEKNINDLISGKPIQYIVNNQVFYGLNFYVDENVLIPQPDTECLVEEVIQIGEELDKKVKILDICTGSGAIAIALERNLENANVFASDISSNALEIAKRNSKINNTQIKFIQSDMFKNINEKFDIIVSNPPYIETETIKTLSKEVQNEPILALDGGKDGLKFYKILANEAKKYLKKDGYLILEIGYLQKNAVTSILEQNGFCDIYSKKDLSENDRIIVGKVR